MTEVITAAGVLVALFIGAMQVYVALQQKNIANRQHRISSLQGEIQAVSSWLPFLKDTDSNVRYMTVDALQRIGTEAALAPLVMALSDNEEYVQERAATALSQLVESETVNTEKCIAIIVQILENQDERTRDAIRNTLLQIGHKHPNSVMLQFATASEEIKVAGQSVVDKLSKRLDAIQHLFHGTELLQADDYEEALEAFDRVIELDPDDGDAWAGKGLALAKLDQPDQARSTLNRGAELNGDSYKISRAYAALGDKDKALAHLSVATQKDPMNKIFASSVDDEFAPLREDESFVKLTYYTDQEITDHSQRELDEAKAEAERWKEKAQRIREETGIKDRQASDNSGTGSA